MADTNYIVCPHCESVNRVPANKPAAAAKCGRCHETLFTGTPVAVSAPSFEHHLRGNTLPIVVDFWAEWCGPCRMMAPVFARIAGEFEPRVRFLKLDTEAAPEIATRYNIRSIPMLILFRSGATVAQLAGAVDGQTLRAWIQQHAAVPAAA